MRWAARLPECCSDAEDGRVAPLADELVRCSGAASTPTPDPSVRALCSSSALAPRSARSIRRSSAASAIRSRCFPWLVFADRQRECAAHGGLAALALQLDVQAQLVGRVGVADRLVVGDQAFVVELEQRPVEGAHAELARLAHDRLELVELALEDPLGDGRRVEQDLDRRHAPLPSSVRTSRCETIARRLADRSISSCLRRSSGKKLMIRSIVWLALLACSVPRHRCPVSANAIACSIVSASRISPIRITSGAWRSVFFSAWCQDACRRRLRGA